MNGNFFAIKVNSLDQGVAYIGIDSIASIHQSSRLISGQGEVETCTILLVNQFKYDVMAKVDEVYTAIASAVSVFSKLPEVGFPKAEPQSATFESQDARLTDEHDYKYVLTPVQQEIVDIVKEYSSFGRYRDFSDAMEYCNAPKLHVDDADERELRDICVEYDIVQVYVDGYNDPFEISYFSDDEQKRLLAELKEISQWDRLFQWLTEQTSVAEYIAIHNEACLEPKYDSHAEPIYENSEANINAFGLDAGTLAKSMINGNYKKDEEWITVENGELISTNNPCEYVDGILLTDWMLKRSEFAKNVMPEDTYAKIFG